MVEFSLIYYPTLNPGLGAGASLISQPRLDPGHIGVIHVHMHITSLSERLYHLLEGDSALQFSAVRVYTPTLPRQL